MARKEMILTEAGAQLYRTRMLKAGDPIVLDGPTARLYGKTGWAADKPKRASRPVEVEEPIIPTVEEVLTAEVVQEPSVEQAEANRWQSAALEARAAPPKPAAAKKAAPRKARKAAAKK